MSGGTCFSDRSSTFCCNFLDVGFGWFEFRFREGGIVEPLLASNRRPLSNKPKPIPSVLKPYGLVKNPLKEETSGPYTHNPAELSGP